MAHQIESMMSVKLTPWHKLGVVVQEAPTAADAIKLAGLDWGVRLAPLQIAGDAPRPVEACAVVRDSDQAILCHHIGPKFVPLQNADAFRWFDPFVEAGECTFETAGSLADGKRVWVMAKLNRRPAEIVPGDNVEKYLLLSNSHDGSMAVRVSYTPVRVVCANTLAAAHSSGESSFVRIRHTKGMKDTLAAVRDVCDNADAQFEATAEQYRELARRKVNPGDLKKYVKQVMGLTDDAKVPGRLCTRSQDTLDSIVRRYSDQQEIGRELLAAHREREEVHVAAEQAANASLLDMLLDNYEGRARGSDEVKDIRGTWWTAYNAVTDYLSHERGKTADGRLNSLWFGDSAKLSQLALSSAMAMSA